MRLDLNQDVVGLTAALVDIPSESGSEGTLAQAVFQGLAGLPWLKTQQLGNCVVAATQLGRCQRVVLAGHLDTVPAADNLPHQLRGDRLVGLGACDMKGGVAVALRLAAHVPEPVRDVTYVFYDCEEVAADRNGLGRIARERPQWLVGDFAVLLEPSNAGVEAGCQGTIRAELATTGVRAHSARGWMGRNAIHQAAQILVTLESYQPRRVQIDGLEYREGLNAVAVRGGVAGNVIPDECVVTVNYRFAPDRSPQMAEAHLREVFAGVPLRIVDWASGALPGLELPAVASFVGATGKPAAPKLGWTDVSRFAGLGMPALNYGPGDPAVAHTVGEFVPVAQLSECEKVLRDWLRGN